MPAENPSLLTRSWIPHWALLAGQLAHGASWLLAVYLGLSGLVGFSMPGLAWVHLVALGFLTLVSMAVLVHVFSGFLDLDWRAPRLARWSLLPFALGAWGLAGAFLLANFQGLFWAAALVAVGFAGWVLPAAATLASFRPGPDVSSAVWRAFVLVVGMLVATVALGVAMAWVLGHGGSAWLLSVGPLIHAHLGGVGWLSLLVIGVSARTVKPITGGKSPVFWRHVAASSGLLLGLLLLAVGWATGLGPVVATGAVFAVFGAAVYAVDLGHVLVRARNPHRPPMAFMAASGLYFVAAAVLGAGAVAGRTEWQPAYAFLALAGWLGQMVVAHLHHIGIRVLATIARGEDDETPPSALLTHGLSWASFAAFQAAIVGVAAGLLAQSGALVAASAAAGFVGWLLMGLNVAWAWRRALKAQPGA